MRRIHLAGILILATFAVTACQKEANSLDDLKNAASDVKGSAADLATQGEDLVNSVKNLSQDKIEEIAQIAAKFENAPSEAQEMLQEQGWTKDQFDKMVTAIRNNPELNKVFESAKKMAAQSH